ncbi:MAG TPA: PDZ domain-containing protein, partial [Candidatus Obscuribacterales bacterium]
SRGLRVYLGTIPDYASGDIKGLRISGVAAGGPAETAGLQAGDVIIELGGKHIENIYDYTYAIDTLSIGKPTPITVLRNGKEVKLTITPGSRN